MSIDVGRTTRIANPPAIAAFKNARNPNSPKCSPVDCFRGSHQGGPNCQIFVGILKIFSENCFDFCTNVDKFGFS